MSLIKVKPRWRDLAGVDAWLPELKALLEDARQASERDGPAPRLAVSAYLAGFIQESYPQTPDMDRLDELARKMAVDVLERTVDDRLAALAERTAEYVKIEKELKAAAERGELVADSIRLKGITGLIESATQVIASGKALAASLDDSKASDKKVAELIETTVEAVERLRTAVGRLL